MIFASAGRSACLLFVLIISCFVTAPAWAQLSYLEVGDGYADWANASAWSNGIVNGAGASAGIRLAPDAIGTVSLLSTVTLEELIVSGRGSVATSPRGQLLLERDGAGELAIRLRPEDGALTFTFSPLLKWAVGETLHADVPLQASFMLNGSLGASGNLLKTGGGTMRIGSANASWAGHLDVAGGTLIAGHAQSLGTTAGKTTIRGGGRLVLEHSTAESLVFNDGTLQLANKDVNGAVELQGAASIFRPRNPNVTDPRLGTMEQSIGVTNVYGVVSGSGSLAIENQSRDQILLWGNNTYTGHTYISAGAVFVQSAAALGDVSQGTTITGGALDLRAATAEPIFVRGGTLSYATTNAAAGPITLQSGAVNLGGGAAYGQVITLDQASNASISGFRVLSGGVVGTGDVALRGELVVDGAPIANDGNLIIAGVGSQRTRLVTANSFTGSLVVQGGEAIVEHQQQVGRPVQIDGGMLNLIRTDSNLTHEVSITRGALQTVGEVSGPIVLASTTTSPISLRGGRLSGVISGMGDVDFVGREDQTISGDNTFEGIARVGGGVVNANSATAFGSTRWATVATVGTLNVNVATNERFYIGTGGILNLNAPTPQMPKMLTTAEGQKGVQQLVVNAPSSFAGPTEVANGRLQVNANTSVGSLIVRNGAQVTVAAGSSLQAAGGVELRNGRLEGTVTGAPFIRKTTFGGAQLGAMPQFAGEIVVEQGLLEVYSGSLGTTAGATRVARGAQLMLRGAGTIADDIYLENAVGPMNRGGLFAGGVCCSGTTTAITGRVDLGATGSIIGGAGNGRDGMMNFHAPVSGGSLTTWGNGVAVRLLNANNLYTGVTDIRQGYVDLAGNGRLSRTSGIVIHESPGTFDATLILDNQAGGSNVDRVDAQVPVEFRGGNLSAFGGGSEAFGTLRFAEGHSAIDARDMTISATRIERQAGATLALEIATPLAIAESPANVGGLLPWMTVRGGSTPWGGPYYDLFGELVNGQIRALDRASIITSVNLATASDNVGVPRSTTATLTDDRTVKSLLLEFTSAIDLGGHTLTVQSGGVSAGSSEIRNGDITAADGRELIIHGAGRVSANIVDGAAGPLDVTVFGGFFSGANAFTGKLFVNEEPAHFTAENSLPAGIDVSVVGGALEVDYAPTGVKQMGKLRIAGGGELAGDGQFSFDEISLESGSMQIAKLAGDGAIRKSTIGAASIIAAQLNDASYTGQIVVDEGQLSVKGLPGASYEVNGGRLQLEQSASPITLNGGELEFRNLSGPIEVAGSATLMAVRTFHGPHTSVVAGALSGAGELTFNSDILYLDAGDFSRVADFGIDRNNPEFSGEVQIQAANVTIGEEQALGTGEVTIHAGGSLNLSSWGSEDGVRVDNQITLSGGVLKGLPSSELAGALHVAKPSHVGGLKLVGSVYLNDAPLTTLGEEPTRFLGRLHVGANSTLAIGRFQGWSRGNMELGGTIVAEQANSVLNIEYSGLDDLLFSASLHVDAGRSLQILEDNAPTTLALTVGQSISGNGVVKNDILLSHGGTVAPGASTGTLTVEGDVNFDFDSRFKIELAAGQHDKLIVSGDATLGGGLLDISFLDGFVPQKNAEFTILEAASLTGMFSNSESLLSIVNGWRVDWDLSQVGTDLVLKATGSAQQGDFDGNGVVDGADLAVWRNGFGANGDATHGQGDADGNGVVDGADLMIWQRQASGLASPPASAGVPEPASAALLGMAALAAVLRRRSQRPVQMA